MINSLVVGVPREIKTEEHRVAITPDGVTEMTIRFLDIAPRDPQDRTGDKPYSYTGKVTEAMGGWDLDNDSTKGNEFDFDMSWKFTSATDGSRGETIDYTKYSDKYPEMKAPQWVLDGKYFRYDNWRKIEDFCYVTHDKCFDEMWKNTNWGDCWISFDEDDDECIVEEVDICGGSESWVITNKILLACQESE